MAEQGGAWYEQNVQKGRKNIYTSAISGGNPRTWLGQVGLVIFDIRLFEHLRELRADVSVPRVRGRKYMGKRRQTYVVGGLTEYLSTIRRFCTPMFAIR